MKSNRSRFKINAAPARVFVSWKGKGKRVNCSRSRTVPGYQSVWMWGTFILVWDGPSSPFIHGGGGMVPAPWQQLVIISACRCAAPLGSGDTVCGKDVVSSSPEEQKSRRLCLAARLQQLCKALRSGAWRNGSVWTRTWPADALQQLHEAPGLVQNEDVLLMSDNRKSILTNGWKSFQNKIIHRWSHLGK